MQYEKRLIIGLQLCVVSKGQNEATVQIHFKGLWRDLVRACVHSLVSHTPGPLGHVFITNIKTYLFRHVLFIFVCLKDELVHHDVK